LAYTVQLRDQKLDSLSSIVDKIKEFDKKRSGSDTQFTFDIERDVDFINDMFEMTRHFKASGDGKEEEKDQAQILTIKKTIGEKVSINFKTYDIALVRRLIKSLKEGGESLTLTFGPNDPEFDFTAYETLSIKGLTLNAPAGQQYWTVGSNFDFDIVLPKLAQTLGGQVAIIKRGGQYFVKDISSHGLEVQTQIKLARSENPGDFKYPIAAGDIVNFASVVYNVNQAGAHYNLTLIKEIVPSGKEIPATIDMATEDGITVGKLKKNKVTVPHPEISGAGHSTLFADHIEDKSTNGTFINYHNRATFVPVPAGTAVRIGDIDIYFK